jgi:DsbC/DsbD-like thiol-disulfide interchange protein
MKNPILPAILFSLSALPLAAQSQDDVLSASLMPGWQEGDGTRIAALHLQLAPHWKTYWRAPGEAGIPPVFDWSDSENLASAQPLWPSPQVITLNGMESIGYLDDLVLPFRIVPQDQGNPVVLRLSADLGVCKDICMPAHLELEARLDGMGTPDSQIEHALGLRPLTAVEAGLEGVSCEVAPIQDGLHLSATLTLPRQGDPETLVFELDDPTIWIAEATEARSGESLMGGADMVASDAAPFVLDRSQVTITVIGQDRSVEIKGCPAS